MGKPYYEPGEQRAAKVEELFTRIARRYDLINDLQSFGLHRYWKQRVIRLSCVQAGERALDLCCGTGDLALGLARRGAAVTGLDFSAAMLGIARTRCAELRLKGGVPRFVLGDAQQIPFFDESFEVVTVGYGLRNLANWQAGLREMTRVATPGGRLIVLDFGKPDRAVWRGIYFGYLRLFVPWLGRIFCGDAGAYAYILDSLRHYTAQHGVAAGMRELGLANVQILTFLGGVMSIQVGEKPT